MPRRSERGFCFALEGEGRGSDGFRLDSGHSGYFEICRLGLFRCRRVLGGVPAMFSIWFGYGR